MNMLLLYLGEVLGWALLWRLSYFIARWVMHLEFPLPEEDGDGSNFKMERATGYLDVDSVISNKSFPSSPSSEGWRKSSGCEDRDAYPDCVSDGDMADALTTKMRTEGAAHYLSNVHAVSQTLRGLRSMVRLWHAPALLQMYHPGNRLYAGYEAPTPLLRGLESAVYNDYLRYNDEIVLTNRLFASYMVADLVLMVTEYPTLGRMDMIMHHCLFLFCSLVGGYYQVNTFMFSWLIIGEASTPLRNVSWVLRLRVANGGKGGIRREGTKRAIKVVEFLFGAVFFVTRVCVYAVGMMHQVRIMGEVPSHVPRWAVHATFGGVVAGFGLNMAWALGMIAKAVRGINLIGWPRAGGRRWDVAWGRQVTKVKSE